MANREKWMSDNKVYIQREIKLENLTGKNLIDVIHEYDLENVPIGFTLYFNIDQNNVKEQVTVICRGPKYSLYRSYDEADRCDP